MKYINRVHILYIHVCVDVDLGVSVSVRCHASQLRSSILGADQNMMVYQSLSDLHIALELRYEYVIPFFI